MELNKIYQGNCLDILKTFPDNSIDACITDPPYGLSDHKPDDVLFILKEWLNGNDSLIPNKKGFMGKGWDAFVPPPAVWKEVLRVLKPGAHCLVFAGTRTVDLMGISLRLGGFEIRDEIVWCYGSGFPKSYNIAKGIEAKIKLGSSNWSDWKNLDGDEYKTGYTKMQYKGGYRPDYSHVKSKDIYLTTDEAKQWEGWGTALKPAIEPIIVARKPLEKGLNVAENCLKWGTGGLNIDGCRIEYKNEQPNMGGRKNAKMGGDGYGFKIEGRPEEPNMLGRFPANLILDGSEEVEQLFPETKPSRKTPQHDNRQNKRKSMFLDGYHSPENSYNDFGSASRFFYKAEFSEDDFVPLFYCPKVSRGERNIGTNKEDNYCVHPTVKPLKLIEYLVKLITRRNQIVLDPFIGSGTTGMACKKLGRNYIGIEINDDYIKIAEKRIAGTLVNETLFDTEVIYEQRF